MGARQRRQTNSVDVLLDRDDRDLLWCLMQPCVDDLASSISQCPCDDFGTAIMPIEPGFGDKYASRHRRQ